MTSETLSSRAGGGETLRLVRDMALPISQLSMAELLARMTPSRSRKALGLMAWLLGPDQRERTGSVVEELCERLLDAGLPLDRYGSTTSMVTAEHDAISRIWTRGGQGVTQTVYVAPEDEDPEFLTSPYYAAKQTQQWVELWLAETPDNRFGIVPSLKKAGFIHYICMTVNLTNGADAWVTVATRRESGFSEQDLLTIAFMLPALSTRIDARVGWATLDKLLRTYVGDEPHNAILAGRAKRGQVSTIRAAMLIADLRDSTGHTAELSAVQAVDLFNDLFDCLVPPIEGRNGEVLKYLGDGLLAIFRESKEQACDASDRALAAAEAALATIQAFNASHPDRRPMQVGIALHYGEIAYGNVGSGARLDFTVIGRDVGLASRIASLNAKLSQPLLLSAAFVTHARRGARRLGLFPLRGFDTPMEIFRPEPPATPTQGADDPSTQTTAP